MLDLLLVHQSSGSWEKAISNYSLPLSLISAVREVPEEYNIKLIDVRIVGKKALDQYLIQDGLLVGFSVLTGLSIKNALEIIHYIRAANPLVKILLGGIHPTILPEQTLSSPKIDYIIIGPGEIPLKNLLASQKTGSPDVDKIKGLGFKRGNKPFINPPGKVSQQELNSYHLPAYSLLDIKHYVFDYNKQPTIYVESSRGCNFHCAFCSNAALKCRWVPYSPAYVVHHLEYLYTRYGIKSFIFVDLDFFMDLERIREFCLLLISKKLKVFWHAQGVRVQEMLWMDREFIYILKKSGFREFEAVGVESGSQRVVDMMGKGFLVKDIPPLNRKFSGIGIPLRYNFFIGSPGEGYGDVRESINLALKLNSENPLSSNSIFYIYTPYPGTGFFEKAIAAGFNPPKSFKEWGNLREWDRAIVPLYSPRIRRKLEKIHFLSIFTTIRYWEKYFQRFRVLKILFLVYRRIAIFRLKRDIFFFMPEFLLWRWIRKS